MYPDKFILDLDYMHYSSSDVVLTFVTMKNGLKFYEKSITINCNDYQSLVIINIIHHHRPGIFSKDAYLFFKQLSGQDLFCERIAYLFHPSVINSVGVEKFECFIYECFLPLIGRIKVWEVAFYLLSKGMYFSFLSIILKGIFDKENLYIFGINYIVERRIYSKLGGQAINEFLFNFFIEYCLIPIFVLLYMIQFIRVIDELSGFNIIVFIFLYIILVLFLNVFGEFKK